MGPYKGSHSCIWTREIVLFGGVHLFCWLFLSILLHSCLLWDSLGQNEFLYLGPVHRLFQRLNRTIQTENGHFFLFVICNSDICVTT